jgi:hypothetical protein
MIIIRIYVWHDIVPEIPFFHDIIQDSPGKLVLLRIQDIPLTGDYQEGNTNHQQSMD